MWQIVGFGVILENANVWICLKIWTVNFIRILQTLVLILFYFIYFVPFQEKLFLYLMWKSCYSDPFNIELQNVNTNSQKKRLVWGLGDPKYILHCLHIDE